PSGSACVLQNNSSVETCVAGQDPENGLRNGVYRASRRRGLDTPLPNPPAQEGTEADGGAPHDGRATTSRSERALQRVMANFALFSEHVVGTPLRPYQLEPAAVIIDSVSKRRGL